MAKHHQEDRGRPYTHAPRTLCGIAMPTGSMWDLDSCERCARVRRAMDERQRHTRQVRP